MNFRHLARREGEKGSGGVLLGVFVALRVTILRFIIRKCLKRLVFVLVLDIIFIVLVGIILVLYYVLPQMNLFFPPLPLLLSREEEFFSIYR